MSSRPNFFIVGNPKSGTTSIHLMLSQHPEIFMSSDKEPLYFCKDIHAEAKKNKKNYPVRFRYRTEKKYLLLFSKAEQQKIIGESSTHYLFSKTSATEIHEFNPSARILILLRNPVTFLSSYHSHMVALSQETETDLLKALQLETARKRGLWIPKNTWCPSFIYYSEHIKYESQVRRFFESFDRHQVKVIIYEDFRKDNSAVLKTILSFLEVRQDFKPNLLESNPNKSPRSKFINDLMFTPSFSRATKILFPENSFLRNKLKNLVKSLLWDVRERKPLQKETFELLKNRCLPEVIKISELLGMDLVKKWGFDGS